ncbi:hypothetical protein PTSG_08321 [Salpingoeca rosetta]|uniref:alpha-L-rhamnosidase n=1 Tax=Salpingoeca rosetta (strain ATCC 50818 / BSB-021) TaxID=946362 RepID=F2UJC9_SALR5|nr:uncharacterized protein PTSG_08321 [Salpingoeca rosetta]EGD77228.1 hypothetical protein PTSG_08321 [Salpingoeca rosetta]|eukprot:XP_004990572.1 hypothetical protein PTSG_08321 [Salpingoeca rosetta]
MKRLFVFVFGLVLSAVVGVTATATGTSARGSACQPPSLTGDGSGSTSSATLHVNELRSSSAPAVVDVSEYVTLAWERAHSTPTETQQAYWISITDSQGRSVACVQQHNTSTPHHVLEPRTFEHGEHTATLRWQDSKGQWSLPATATFEVADPNWGGSQWIGDGRRFHAEVTLSAAPETAKLYISGIGFYKLYINGVDIDTGAVLNGAWSVWNARVLFDSINVAPYLKSGTNAIGVMLGGGWRNTTQFPPQSHKSSCDAHNRLLRAVLEVNGSPVLRTNTTWMMSSTAPITDDSIYNGETYDARLESDKWKLPHFTPSPSSDWTHATQYDSCFSPTMTARSFPPIKVQEVRPPVNINKLTACPQAKVGGLAAENTDLVLTCASGTISGIEFASFGTPTGSCGNFSKGSCDAASTMKIVQSMCVGKSSCTIPATDTTFGDPCYGTAKVLAVQATGCSASPYFVVDFGENLSGLTRISVRGSAGTVVTLRHAEVLQHPPYGPADGNIYTGNLRTAKATDTYILRGDADGEEYIPSFTYHGFRYVEVRGYPGELKSENISQLHFRTDNQLISSFKSSSKVLNAIQYGAYRGQGSNMMSVPTDCDQRDERLGWMGDASLSADSFALNYASKTFMSSFVRSIVDDQDPASGSLPDVVPYQRYGGQPADPSWSAAFPQNVWVRYKHGGDTTMAKQWWHQLGFYVANLEAQVAAAKGFSNWKPPYGDWVPAGKKVDGQVCSAFSFIMAAQQMSELAAAIGNTTAAHDYASLADSLRQKYRAAFYHSSTNCFDDCGQTATALSLFVGAVPSDHVNASVASLLTDIEKQNNNHVTVGIIGAKALFPVLSEYGAQKQAVALAEQTSQPSWGYMFFNTIEPATSSVWELWDSPTQGPGMNSRNHHMFSSISGWLITYVGGLRHVACGSTLLMAPAFHGLSSTSVSLNTTCGRVAVSHVQIGGTHRASVPRDPTSTSSLSSSPAVLSCGGDGGGVIASVSNAAVTRGPNATCAVDITAIVARQCAGAQECELDWTSLPPACDGDTTAPSHVPHLHTTFTCSVPARHTVTAVVPVGERAQLFLPTTVGTAIRTPHAATSLELTTFDGVPAYTAVLPGGVHTWTFSE